ncbi:MAG: diacylglycerol kinase family protein [Spirochaetota bacterium]
MKRLIIINPKSRHGKSLKIFRKLEPSLRDLLGEYELYETTAAKDCTEKVRSVLLRQEYEQILIAGGDGSINEAVNGYFTEEAAPINSNVPIGIINLGTGGDFIKTMQANSPNYYQALQQNRYQKVDCGISYLKAFSKAYHFANISSIGMAGDINISMKASSFQYGILAYFWHTLKVFSRYQAPRCTIRIKSKEGKWYETKSTLMNFFACNGQYNGGGMHWAPNSSIQNGELDFVLIEGISKWKLFFDSYKVYSGKVDAMAGTRLFRGSEAHIISEGYTSQELDGEVREMDGKEYPLEFHFKVLPQQIPFNF